MTVTQGWLLVGDGDDPGDHGGGQHGARRVGHRHQHDLLDAGILGVLAVPDHHRGVGLGGVEQLHQAGHAGAGPGPGAAAGRCRRGRVVAALVGIGGLVAAIVVFAQMLRSEEGARRFGLLAGRVASRLLGMIGRAPDGFALDRPSSDAACLLSVPDSLLPVVAAVQVHHRGAGWRLRGAQADGMGWLAAE
jgi:hypothetical protein